MTNATTPNPTTTFRGILLANLFVFVVLCLFSLALTYGAAFVVVKLGLGGPRLFVTLPLLGLLALAFGLLERPIGSSAHIRAVNRINLLTVGFSGLMLILLTGPADVRPAGLFQTDTEIHNVNVDWDRDELAIETSQTSRMPHMPSIVEALGLSTQFSMIALLISSGGLFGVGFKRERLAKMQLAVSDTRACIACGSPNVDRVDRADDNGVGVGAKRLLCQDCGYSADASDEGPSAQELSALLAPKGRHS